MIPQQIRALDIINKAFKRENYDVYLVGGCCRDLYMSKRPKDYDLTTKAIPSDVCKICDKYGISYYRTGEQYGTITLIINSKPYEITTFRLDQDYYDGRRPSEVKFSNNLLDDLARRDFTMNAMAIKLEDYLHSDFTNAALNNLLIDPYNGKEDIDNKEIKCVGTATDRFNEDGLRILRAIRFAMRYNFAIEENTLNAIYENHNCLNYISYERIQNEFNEIILNFNLKVNDLTKEEYLNKWKLMCFIVKKLFPEMYELSHYTHNSAYHLYDIFTHSMLVCGAVNTDCLSTKLAALFHDIGKMKVITHDDKYLTQHFYEHAKESVKLTTNILKRLKYSNGTIDDTLTLIAYHDSELRNHKPLIKRLLNKVGKDLFEELLELKLADRLNHLGCNSALEYDAKSNIIDTYIEIIEEQEAFSIKDLAISGKDLIEMGFKPGPKFKDILENCLAYCIEKPEENTKEKLLKFIEPFK